jgi:hypothetical protein
MRALAEDGVLAPAAPGKMQCGRDHARIDVATSYSVALGQELM